MSSIDVTDARILSVLQRRGRISNAELADEINLLHEGATAVAQVTGATEAALQARRVAEKLIH